MKNVLLIFILALLFSIYTFAKDLPLAPRLQPLYETLKTLPVNYKPDGAVCEQIARLQALDSFPGERFAVNVGVEYDLGAGTLGELDLVVTEKATGQVVSVAEVKCWHSLDEALDKAKEQQDRFLWNLSQYAERIHFVAHEAGVGFQARDFKEIKSFVFISQRGGLRKGFHQEIPYTLSEVDELRAKLVRCQNQGQCPLAH